MENIKICCIVPHAPILVLEVGGSQIERVRATSESLSLLSREIRQLSPETLVVVSPPHLRLISREGFPVKAGKRVYGSLARFGAPGAIVDAATDTELIALIEEHASTRNIRIVRDFSDREDDWGLIVPLCLIAPPSYRVVSISISPYLSLREHYELGIAIRNAVEESSKPCVFISSGDMSHRLTPDAPSGYHPRGKEFDELLVNIVRSGNLSKIFDIDPSLSDDAGEDCLWSISVLAGICENQDYDTSLLSYEGSFGVGYMVARISFRNSTQNHRVRFN